jgi:hypothetical protein
MKTSEMSLSCHCEQSEAGIASSLEPVLSGAQRSRKAPRNDILPLGFQKKGKQATLSSRRRPCIS